jgi:hypothetical protein
LVRAACAIPIAQRKTMPEREEDPTAFLKEFVTQVQGLLVASPIKLGTEETTGASAAAVEQMVLVRMSVGVACAHGAHGETGSSTLVEVLAR